MTEEDQNIAMAKLAGYRWYKGRYTGPLELKNKNVVNKFIFCKRFDINQYNDIYQLYNTNSEGDYKQVAVPDYVNDLSLVTDFEKKYILNDPSMLGGANPQIAISYLNNLREEINSNMGNCHIKHSPVSNKVSGNGTDVVFLMCASAKERVAAILKTFGKWV